LFVEQKLLPPKSIFQIAKLEVACYRRMAQLGNDRRMLVAWIRKYAPEGSIDQAMAYIEGKDSFSPVSLEILSMQEKVLRLFRKMSRQINPNRWQNRPGFVL
jgi:hypothetical protein